MIEEKILKLQEKGIFLKKIVSLSLANTKFDEPIKEILENYGTRFEYPEKLSERVNLKEINIFDNNYKEIDWKDYNWLVVAYKLKDRHILKIHLQLKELKIFLWVNKMKIDKGRVMWFLFLIISFVVITFRLIQIKKVKNINQKQVSIFEKKFNDFLIEKFNSNVETIVITDYTKKSEREIISYALKQGYKLNDKKIVKTGLGTDKILIFRKNIKVKIRKDWV